MTPESAVRALEDEHAALLLMLNAAPVGCAQLRADGTVEMLNSVCARWLMPLAPDGDLSNLFDLIEPLTPGLRERVAAFQAPVGTICQGLRLELAPDPHTGDPRTRCLSLTLTRLDNERLLLVLADITNEVHAQLALREREARLKLTMAAAQIAACEFDLQTDDARPSPGLPYLLGLAGPLTDWRAADFFAQIHDDDRPAALASFREAIAAHGPWQHEFRLRAATPERWLLARGQMLEIGQEPPRLLCLLMDITRSRDALQAHARAQMLEEENRLMHAASELKTSFLVALAHKLRTPLTGIFGFAELLATKSPHEVQRDQARMILDNARQLRRLVDQTIDLAALDANCMDLQPSETDLPPLLAALQSEHLAAAADKGLSLNLELGPTTPRRLVCDAGRLEQVLTHLLTNAIKFTESGEVRLRAWADEDEVSFEVCDTGPGIAPEFHDSVFERFHQASGLGNHEHGGTGLGLALARSLSQAMGGRLVLQSGRGEGARFSLHLPRR